MEKLLVNKPSCCILSSLISYALAKGLKIIDINTIMKLTGDEGVA